MSGWSPAPLRRTVSPDPEKWPSLAPAEGSEPLIVTLNNGLTFKQINAIPFGPAVTYGQLWTAIAPYVLEWNVEGEKLDGTTEILPAPAEAGHTIFENVRKTVVAWLAWELRFGAFEDNDRGKDVKSSEPTQNGSSETSEDSPTTDPSPTSPTTTTSSTGSTPRRRRSKNGSTRQPSTGSKSSLSSPQ